MHSIYSIHSICIVYIVYYIHTIYIVYSAQIFDIYPIGKYHCHHKLGFVILNDVLKLEAVIPFYFKISF